MSVLEVCAHSYAQRPEEGIKSSGVGVTGGDESPNNSRVELAEGGS